MPDCNEKSGAKCCRQVMTVFVNGGSCDGFISKELVLGLEVRMFLGNVENHGEDVS